MIVKCIKSDSSSKLTVGADYKVHKVMGGFKYRFTITNDLGLTNSYSSDKFVYVSGEMPPYKPSRVGKEFSIKNFANTADEIEQEIEFERTFKKQKPPPEVMAPIPEYCKKHFWVFPCQMCK